MELLNENQEKYYCNACNSILSNGVKVVCSCNEICWCVTCATFCGDQCSFCSKCSKAVCKNCRRKNGFTIICQSCNLDNLLLISEPKPKKKNTIMSLSGKIVVITGRLKSMKRKHAESLVITSGGDVGSAISRNTDFIVVGENPGSKLCRAKELGIPTITETEFLAIAKQKVPQSIKTKATKTEPTKKRRIIL